MTSLDFIMITQPVQCSLYNLSAS